MSSAAGSLTGVTVLPEYLQSETVNAVLDRLQAVGVNAVTTSPYVMEEADEQTGAREPPSDAGAGHVRFLDRTLWGKRELWVRTSPSFAPDTRRYEGLRYQPPVPDALTRQHGKVVGQFLDNAKGRGMQVFLQVQAAVPPGYRVQFGGPLPDDQPRLPDGEVPRHRVANNASLASPHIVAYQRALLTDLCRQYPQLDGIRVDWPEYPPYSLDDCFVDFSSHAREAAGRLGFDFERMRCDTAQLYSWLHGGLTAAALSRCQDEQSMRFSVAQLCLQLPGVAELTRFKVSLVVELLGEFRQAIDLAGGTHIGLVPNFFPWPWSLVSGAGTYQQAAGHCAALAVKLYGMHWKMMMRTYYDRIREHHPDLDRCKIVRALLNLLDIMDEPVPLDPEAYRYTRPDEAHGVGAVAQRRKIELARAAIAPIPVYALAHSYGPADDFRRRLQVARGASPHGVWINRYGYLSDEKLAMIAQHA